jgi:catechol 2,3-dioxygenase-like lactoylglutathione lyase family enzyme
MTDERPPVWIGHAALRVADVGRATEFWERIGLRKVFGGDEIGIFELRGGTHLVLVPSADAPDEARFDLMVDDVRATHDSWAAAGMDVTDIEHGDIHDHFFVRDPDGRAIVVNSTHVVGAV